MSPDQLDRIIFGRLRPLAPGSGGRGVGEGTSPRVGLAAAGVGRLCAGQLLF